MIRVVSLLWTLIIALLVSGISFFYINGDRRGFPFTFASEYFIGGFEISFWAFLLNLIFWWFLFSILWIVIKNYIWEP